MVEPGAASRSPRVRGSARAHRVVAALAVLAAVLVAPAGAWALKLKSCKADSDFVCASIRVPLDHGGAAPGTVKLAVAAQRRYPKGAGLLVALSGGPGQSSVDAAESFALSLEPMLRRYRLVVLDQRGTGRSGALQCSAIQRLGGLEEFTSQAVARCADRIGPRRAFYRTADSVSDLEDLRRAFGAPKIALMGISYGTWVAQEYARTYPSRTDSLILDSIVGPGPTDGFGLDNFKRLPRILGEQCSRSRCKGATANFARDIGKVASRIRTAPLRGTVFNAAGRASPTRYSSESQLYFLVTSGDLNPFLQARMPGAIGSAARGDLGPLLRLKRIGEGPPTKTSDLSFGLNVATGCLDAEMPFPLSSDPAGRLPGVLAALAQIPPAEYAPWSTDVVRQTSYSDDCLLWPRDDRPRATTGALPDVRALLLSGRLDMRTPLEDAVRVQATLPRSQLVVVPGNGHDQVDTDGTGCVERALTRFTARLRVGTPCKGKTNQVPPLPRAPVALSDFRSPAKIPGPRGRTLLAVLDTAEDARFSALEAVYGGFSPRGGGLRGGSFSATDAFSGVMTLRSYSYVPGVRVSGRLVVDGARMRGRLRVTGKVRGVLNLRSTTAASGVLGGRRVAFARTKSARASGAEGSRAFPAIPRALLDRAALRRRLPAR